MTSGRRVHLDFEECSISSEDGQTAAEVVKILLSGHEREIPRHEIRGEESVAARAIALRSGGQVQIGSFQKFPFKIESSLIDLLILVSEQGPH